MRNIEKLLRRTSRRRGKEGDPAGGRTVRARGSVGGKGSPSKRNKSRCSPENGRVK